MLGCGSYINLQGEVFFFLQQSIVQFLNVFKPTHPRIMDVVGFVVKYGQFVHFAYDLSEVGLAVCSLTSGLGAEWLHEKVAQIIILQGRGFRFVKINPMEIGQEDVPGLFLDSNIVLDVEIYLKVVSPIPPLVSVVGENWILKENLLSIEICPQPIQNNDIGRNQKKVS